MVISEAYRREKAYRLEWAAQRAKKVEHDLLAKRILDEADKVDFKVKVTQAIAVKEHLKSSIIVEAYNTQRLEALKIDTSYRVQ